MKYHWEKILYMRSRKGVEPIKAAATLLLVMIIVVLVFLTFETTFSRMVRGFVDQVKFPSP